MRHLTFAVFGVFVATILASGFGCELISTVDRSKVPGTGGGGGQATTTSSTSSAGGGMPCTAAADCPDPGDECIDRTCDAAVCGTKPRAAGTPASVQTAGDCQKKQCDGSGATVSVNDDTDLPNDGNDCTEDVCTSGVPSNPSKPVNTTCGANGSLQCDGAGKCVECLGAGDCPGIDDECKTRTCNAGVCGTSFTALGTALASQAPHDCKTVVCDGSGGTTAQNDDLDLPDDNNPCTNDLCTSGAPSHTSTMDGTACGANLACLGGVCNGCTAPGDCPGTDDECKTRTCAAAACGFSFAASGTAVAMQTAGDCKKNQCDGSGNTVSATDNADPPADDGNPCTSDVCNAGAPAHPPKAVNAPCNQNGGSFCSAAGQCVQCNAPAQCPGSDTDCQARTCAANACGIAFQPPGTVTSTQTPGDCQVNQCDGAGNATPVIANGDVPADDGNPCTSEVCNAGVPAHPLVAVDTPCNQNGGSFCSAGGQCVQCNAPGQCPGSDTDCQTRTCAANACGLSFAPSGTPTSSQTPGDCKENECDGSGGVVVAGLVTDLPADDGNDCTSEICTAGVPSHPDKPSGAMCNQSGGTLCNGSGACLAAGCLDGSKNGAETDVDCGGGTCPGCANGLVCGVGGDCQSGVCTGGVCVSGKSFNNPVQIDVSALLVDDTIVNNGAGATDTVQVSMDGSGYDLMTASAAKQLGGATGVGLPDNAVFAADANHPSLHLGWDNANDGPNSRVVHAGSSFTIVVPADLYAQLQVYALSTEGSSSMQFTLNYSDATTDVRNVTFGDWFNDPAPAGQFFIIDGLDRVGSSLIFNSVKDPAVVGVSLSPNPAKTLVSVAVNHLASNGWFVFYGAAGW